MNLRMTISVLLAAWLAGCDKASDPVVGTSSETTTGVRLYLPNGAPASGARAELFAVSDTGNIPVSQVFTDGQGRLSLEAPKKGRYNLVIRHSDGVALLQDSLWSDGIRITAWSDTLRPAGSVQGRVTVQPKDSPRIAWVHLLGSGVYANVDDTGSFDLSGVAPGRYTVAFLTQEAAYAPTFRSARVWPDSTLDMGNVDLAYAGLPLVTGLVASYDTTEGVLNLIWNRSKDRRVEAYAVYEGATDSFVLKENARTADTSRSVRLFPVGGMVALSGSSTYGDTTVARRSYRVAVVDSAGTVGPAWGGLAMVMPSPFRLGRREIRWAKIGSIPGLAVYKGSGNYESVVGCDTLHGELVAYVRDTGLALGKVFSSPDGISWRMLSDSVPFRGGVPAANQSGLNLPISWEGELLRVEPLVTGYDPMEGVSGSGSFDSVALLALEDGSWKRRSSHALIDSIDGLWLQQLGAELHLIGLRTVKYGSMSPSFNSYDARQELAWDGDTWRHESVILDTLIAGGTAFSMTLPRFVGGGRWTALNPRWERQWVRPGLASGIGDAVTAPGYASNPIVGDGGEIFLLNGGAYADPMSPNRWRMLSHKGDVFPGMEGVPAAVFWKGNPVIVGYDGVVYVGQVSSP